MVQVKIARNKTIINDGEILLVFFMCKNAFRETGRKDKKNNENDL